MTKSRRGIYYNLSKSEYVVKLDKITLHFSSKLYMNKFLSTYENEIHQFNIKANNIYKNKFELDMSQLAVIRLYELIEKRGFYILIDGNEVTCLDSLRFDLSVENRKN